MKNLQRNNDWHNERKFRFTGSKISNLLGKQGLGKTGESYIFEVVYKGLFSDLEEEYVSQDMQTGIEREKHAFDKLTEILGKQFITTEKCGFFPYEDFGGASPDGLTSDDGVIEIKCPKAKTFFIVVRDNYIDPSYYDQMQMEMLSTGRSKAYYFNYFIDLNGVEFWHLIVVPRDEQRINFIKERMLEARDIALVYKMQLERNRQF